MSEKMTSINPQILVWCREASGVSFEEASKKFGADRLSNWENGVDHPTYTQLQQLCDFYRKPVAVCFFPEPPVFKSLSTSFRTIPSTIKDNLLNRNTIKLVDEAMSLITTSFLVRLRICLWTYSMIFGSLGLYT